jgi:hypothetical protein
VKSNDWAQNLECEEVHLILSFNTSSCHMQNFAVSNFNVEKVYNVQYMGLTRTQCLKKNLVIYQTIVPSFHFRPIPTHNSLCVPNMCDVSYILCVQTAVGTNMCHVSYILCVQTAVGISKKEQHCNRQILADTHRHQR